MAMNKYIISMIIGVLGSGFSVLECPVIARSEAVARQSRSKPAAIRNWIPSLRSQQAAQSQDVIALALRPRNDSTPLVYEYNLKGPLTVESEPMKTDGTIKTISAFADSEGEVRLEISANGGSLYTRIINGQILKDGFIPGNQLRFKVKIAEGGVLKKLILGFTDSSGASRVSNNPSLAKFKFHKPIYISGGSEELFNYPLKIKIGSGLSVLGSGPSTEHRAPSTEHADIYLDGDISPDFKDIYFTAADGESPLNYYAEGEIAASPEPALTLSEAKRKQSPDGGSQVIFWVKVPEIPKEGAMIYLYYGIASPSARNDALPVIASPEWAKQSQKEIASSPTAPRNDALPVIARSEATTQSQDGNKVFSFFDDFNGTALDEGKWQVRPELKGEYILEDGYLRLTGCAIIARNFQMKNGILEFKAKAERDSAIQAIVHGAKAPHSIYPSEEMVYSSGYPGAEHTIAINDVAKLNIGKAIQAMTDYIYKVTLNDLGIIFERYGRDYTKEAEIRFLDSYRNEAGYIGLKADDALTGGGSVYFDWVRVRPYTEVEPQVMAGGGR